MLEMNVWKDNLEENWFQNEASNQLNKSICSMIQQYILKIFKQEHWITNEALVYHHYSHKA